jgi:hypothetical protein
MSNLPEFTSNDFPRTGTRRTDVGFFNVTNATTRRAWNMVKTPLTLTMSAAFAVTQIARHLF